MFKSIKLIEPGETISKIRTVLLINHQIISSCVCVCVCVWIAQLCLTLCNSMDYSPSGPSIHGILQAGILEWIPILFSSGSSRWSSWIRVSCVANRFFTIWATLLLNRLMILIFSIYSFTSLYWHMIGIHIIVAEYLNEYTVYFWDWYLVMHVYRNIGYGRIN